MGGCAKTNQLMPLELGNTWTYQVSSGLNKRVEEIKVTEKTNVGRNTGFVLQSPAGTTTLAWQGNDLVAGRFANSEFFPPLPLYSPLPDGQELKWKGTIRTAGSSSNATATLRSAKSKETIDGTEFELQVGELTIQSQGKTQSVSTWLRPRKGIYRQEHRVNDQLVTRVQYVSGP
ncbi:hypothetical protein C0431_02505 [bacterium]|nr:hypothetical protein [bacterium]